jgi:hypothetical protein
VQCNAVQCSGAPGAGARDGVAGGRLHAPAVTLGPGEAGAGGKYALSAVTLTRSTGHFYLHFHTLSLTLSHTFTYLLHWTHFQLHFHTLSLTCSTGQEGSGPAGRTRG